MNTNFSLKYDGKLIRSADMKVAENIYEIEKDVFVTLYANKYEDYDAVEWVLNFENTSDTNSKIISDIFDCDTFLPMDMPTQPRMGYRPESGDLCVITMRGCVEGCLYWDNDVESATEFNFYPEYLDKAYNKTKTFANYGGRSSEGTMPFFDVTANGGGYIVAVGWSGDWKAEFSGKEDGVEVRTGLKETAFYLKPNEKLRTTSVLIMKYGAGEDKYNKFRRLIKNHFSHKSCSPADRDGIMANELWGGLPSEEMVKRLKEYKKYGIKFEDIWIDAGWYGECTNCKDAFTGDWHVCTGSWMINEIAHPDKFADVKRAAEEIGARLMLWLEPERAINNTTVIAQHPEWFISIDESNENLLNYGVEDAKNFVFNLLCEYVEKLNLSCYRQDFNFQPTAYFKANDEPGRRGITEIKHITGMYDLWEKLINKYPGLIIDNCASGGRRIDIETLKRSVIFFRSDYQCNFNENPEVIQTHNSNLSCYLPYNGCTSKTKSDTYAIRSSYSSSWGGAFYNAIFQSMDESDFEWAKMITEEYKYIRKYMTMDFYNHGAQVLDDTSWAIWQYHDRDEQCGVVMAFRRCNSPFDSVNIELKGLIKDKEYIFRNLDENTEFYGDEKIKIHLPEKRSCTIIEYKIR